MIKNVNKKIKMLKLSDDALIFTFSDNSKIRLHNAKQECSEVRFMRTDDNLSDFIGATLYGAEVKNGPSYDHDLVSDSQFLIVSTSKGEFTVVNYNTHNGYYSGFDLQMEEEK